MRIIRSDAVAVSTYNELKTILEEENEYTLIYLAEDIELKSGISILPSKTEITIDGIFPKGTSIKHKLIEYNGQEITDSLGIHTKEKSSTRIIIRNLIIVGKSYYGTPFISPGEECRYIEITYQNVIYNGPQMTYHPNGLSRYIDCDITIDRGLSTKQEVGEVGNIEFGGTVTIRHPIPDYTLFWFRRNDNLNSVTVLENANVNIYTENNFFRAESGVSLTVKRDASLNIDVRYSMGARPEDYFTNISVDNNAELNIIQRREADISTLQINDSLEIKEDARFYMQADYYNAKPLINFIKDEGSITILNPKSVVLYSRNSSIIKVKLLIIILIKSRQINKWIEAKPLETAGNIDDLPSHSWKKYDNSEFYIQYHLSNLDIVSYTTNDFSETEVRNLPEFSRLHFSDTKVFSVGNLFVSNNMIFNRKKLISGTTLSGALVKASCSVNNSELIWEANAGQTGSYDIIPSIFIPVDTKVLIRSNIPFLFAETTSDVVDLGGLEIIYFPDIEFRIRPISRNPVIFGRHDNTWNLKILDERLLSEPWYLYASIQEQMKGTGVPHELTESLVFIDENGTITPLDENPLLIYVGNGNDGVTKITEVSWEERRGILMQDVNKPFYSSELYTCRITWTLTDTPL